MKGWPPRVVRGATAQVALASSVNQTVKLPRRQPGLVGRPVRDLVLPAWDVVTAILVQLEGQGIRCEKRTPLLC